MANQVTIGGVTYEPSGAVANRFGYTIDYVSRLAREGRVQATQVGRKWFVEASSVERFVEESKVKKIQQNAKLSSERKIEQMSSVSVVGGLAQSVKTEPLRKLNIATALAGSSMVLAAGLLVGVLFNPHVSTLLRGESSNIQVGAPVVSVTQKLKADENVVNSKAFDERFKRTEPVAGMIVFTEDEEELTIEKVKQSFSDEVNVELTSVNSGVVTPVFRNSKLGDTFQFITVPLSES